MPSDPIIHIYILALGLDTDAGYSWVLTAPMCDPSEVLAALRRDTTVGQVAEWADRGGWEHVKVDSLACVDPAWAETCLGAIIERAVREGHPLKNPSARQHRSYDWDQKPPEGHHHVCSLWEPGAERPFYIGATHKAAKQWLHNIKFYSGRPSNTHRPYMQTVQHLLGRKKEPIAKVEATVPEKESRAKVRAIARHYGLEGD
jgi:hypothetical protein